MIGNLKVDTVNYNDLRMVIGSSGRWSYEQSQCIKLTQLFIEKLNKQNNGTPITAMIYNDKELSRSECIELINAFTSMLNEKYDGTPLSVVVYGDEKAEKHKLNMQTVKDNVYIKREKQNEQLSDDEAEAIRALYKDGYKKADIAKVFGISRNTVIKYCK